MFMWSIILTCHDVLPHNRDVVVSVRARLLVHKAQGMHQLMRSHSRPHAPRGLQGQNLISSSLSQKWPAAWSVQQKKDKQEAK